jgi:hypothetical protein
LGRQLGSQEVLHTLLHVGDLAQDVNSCTSARWGPCC